MGKPKMCMNDTYKVISIDCVSYSICLTYLIALYTRSYAYGMGGLEKVAFDSKEKILYGVSEQGFVSDVCLCLAGKSFRPFNDSLYNCFHFRSP